MKIFKGKSRITFIAAAILVVCAGLFIAVTQIMMGSEESAVISQQSAYAATNSPGNKSSDTTDRPELIDKQKAVESFKRMSEEVFGLSIDEKLLTVSINKSVDIRGRGITHYTWDVICRNHPNKHCSVDAVTGQVISFDVDLFSSYAGHPATYPSSMKAGDFNSEYATEIMQAPDNVYIAKALDLVTSKLADGRNILGIETSAAGFISEENNDDPEALGTITVDCKVYMETGMSYTLSFCGVPDGNIVLSSLFAHPTKQACEFDYYYPDQTEYLPPDWQSHSRWPEEISDPSHTAARN